MKKKSRKTAKQSGFLVSRRNAVQAATERMNSVSIGYPEVIDFGDATLREAFRLWWHPHDMGADFDELTGQAGSVIRTTRTRGGAHGADPSRPRQAPGHARRHDRAAQTRPRLLP